MKRVLLAIALATVVGSSSGCCLLDRIFCNWHGGPCGGCGGAPQPCCGPCADCGGGGCGSCCGAAAGPNGGMDDGSAYAGPPSGAVTYPYYTTRGPRDFLASNPRGIGP